MPIGHFSHDSVIVLRCCCFICFRQTLSLLVNYSGSFVWSQKWNWSSSHADIVRFSRYLASFIMLINWLQVCYISGISMGRKFGGSAAPFWVAGSPSNTKSPGPRPSSIPSDILIHAAIWPQQIWAENWGAVPLWGGEMGPHLTQCGQGQGLSACQVSSWSVPQCTNVTDRLDRHTTVW